MLYCLKAERVRVVEADPPGSKSPTLAPGGLPGVSPPPDCTAQAPGRFSKVEISGVNKVHDPGNGWPGSIVGAGANVGEGVDVIAGVGVRLGVGVGVEAKLSAHNVTDDKYSSA